MAAVAALSSAVSPPRPPTPRHVSLDTAMFEEALTLYLEEEKPDQLAQKQAKSWKLEWTDQCDGLHSVEPATNETQWCINGYLEIHGEYMVVRLDVKTRWEWAKDGGKLDFVISARARFRTKSELKKQQKAVDGERKIKTDRNQERVSSKVRSAMLKRLRDDDYIRKLLLDGTESARLMEATVKLRPPDELEERVSLDEDSLEAFRRCVYSQAEDTLNVVSLLGMFPFLHTPAAPLGHRAKLRLLEDAMLDACEREGEEDLLTDLTIDDRPRTSRSEELPKNQDLSQKRRKWN